MNTVILIIIIIVIVIALAVKSRRDYIAMEEHIHLVRKLTAFAPVHGLEWMSDESAQAFHKRMQQKIYGPRPPATVEDIIAMVRKCEGVTNVRIKLPVPGCVDIYVDAEAVNTIQTMVDGEFAAGVDWNVKPLTGEDDE